MQLSMVCLPIVVAARSCGTCPLLISIFACRVAIERNSFAVHTASLDEAIDISNRVAPEHLEVHIKDPGSISHRLLHYGALFVGQGSAEVLGDYGAGPNHTLVSATV